MSNFNPKPIQKSSFHWLLFLMTIIFSFSLIIYFSHYFSLITPNVQAQSNEYYVDKNSRGGACSDANIGTITKPWCTIGKANSVLKAGDTVYVRAGTYSDAIRPSRSGTSEENRIIYRAYTDESVYLTASTPINLGSKAYVTVDGFRMDKGTPFYRFVEIGNAHHITVENCYMKDNSQWGAIQAYNTLEDGSDEWDGGETHHCIIRNNVIINGEGDTIQFDTNCHHNLIENNYIDGANGHAGVAIQGRGPSCDYNIIRNNVFKDTKGTAHAYVMIAVYITHHVVEGNIFDGSPGGDEYAMKLRGEHNIVRYNTVYNSPGYGVHIYSASGWGTHPYAASWHRVYSNTIHNSGNKLGWEDATFSEVSYLGGLGCDYNYYKNNILNIFNYGIYLDKEGDAQIGPHLYTHNIIRKGSGGAVVRYLQSAVTLAEAQSNWPQIFNNNFDVNPLFVDASHQDFHLQSSSPAIDAGTFLTKTTSSGSGTQIKVEDALYFMDGYGIVDGDLIQLEGQTQTARITDIDYENNKITIDRTLTWSSGQGISLPYSGSAPDIGAYEFEGETECGNGICDLGDCSLCVQDCTLTNCLNDGICSSGLKDGNENCSNSPNDCACSSTQICCNNQCIAPVCSQSSDCGSDSCKNYTCNNPGTCLASCSSQEIISCINDDNCCPADCTELNDNDCGNVYLYLEAESGTIITPMQIANDNEASNGKYIYSPTNNSGYSEYEINIQKQDDYVVWGRVIAEDPATDSFFVSINSQDQNIWDILYGGNQNPNWTWDQIAKRGSGTFDSPEFDPRVFNLEAGQNTLTISVRESDTKLDKLLITNDFNYVPQEKPSISLQKQVDKTQASSGDILTYTITYQNTGLAEARNLIVTDNVPNGTEYLDGGTLEEETVKWIISSLLPNGQGQISFRVKVK